MKKEQVSSLLINVFNKIGIDIPSNYDEILEYVFNDVNECADPNDWHSGDVDIAFRRWIESK